MKTSAVDLICRGIAAKSSNKLDNFILPLSSLCSIFHSIGHKDKPFSPNPRINFVAAKSSYKFGTSVLPFSLFCSNFHTMSHKEGPLPPESSIDFSRINKVDYVVSLVRKMVRMRPQPSVAEFNRLLTVVVEMKRYCVALCLFYEMRQWDAAPLNEDTMTIAMKCYCNLSQPKFGFAMLGLFLKCGYTPNGTTFTTLIEGLFMNNKVAEAEELFKKLLSLKLCEPDKVMIFIVVEGLCSFGRILTAYDLVRLSEETSYKPGVDSFNILIDSLWKLCGRIDYAFQLFMKMIDMGISPNDFTYNSIVQGLSKFRRWEEVKDILAKVVDRN